MSSFEKSEVMAAITFSQQLTDPYTFTARGILKGQRKTWEDFAKTVIGKGSRYIFYMPSKQGDSSDEENSV